MEDKLKVVAITGGIGSGKTTVANHFAELGFPVINTDLLAKKLMNSDEKLKILLSNEFGPEIYLENGELNSKFLSKIVFGNDSLSKKNLDKLNRIVHPAVIDLMMEEIEKFANEGNELIFVESALIYEAGLDEGFDYIIVVDANESKRIKWTSEKLKLPESEIRIRNSEQISTDMKKNLADFVIENNGTISEMLASADFILDLVKLA
jgi:dephospho-CoA kinase